METLIMTGLAAMSAFLAAGDGGEGETALEQHLAECDSRYSDDVGMLGKTWHSPGYHTTVPDGEWVHPTRDSLAYALALLQSREPERAARAQKVIRTVISLQDQNAENKTYGIWPWLREEPLEQMSPPDWNWADFCGALLAQMLVEHGSQLDGEIQIVMRDSLGHAAQAIVRRDVGPGYTNIAIMGGGVTAAAGEILEDASLVEYGRDRLRRCVEHYDHHGGFNEYNSPTYTMVALHECERTLQLVKDPETREHAETLRKYAWQIIADHYHPGTGQWAGPHSRDYNTWLPASRAQYIAAQTGIDVPVHPKAPGSRGGWPDLVKPIPCPPELVERFRALPEPEVEVRTRVIRRDTEEASTWITTWLTPGVCLGSVNHDTFWTQRQVVKAYWNGADDVPVMLRLRFLHDGVDFASGYVHNAQQANRLLSAVSLVTNRGDFHPSLDRPKDGVFHAEDFRIRYELIGDETAAKRLDEECYELVAGPYRAIVHMAPGHFADNPVVWEMGDEDGRAFVDGICYRGEKRPFRLPDISEMILVFGLEILPAGKPVTDSAVTIDESEGEVIEASWRVGDGLTVRAPRAPGAYP